MAARKFSRVASRPPVSKDGGRTVAPTKEKSVKAKKPVSPTRRRPMVSLLEDHRGNLDSVVSPQPDRRMLVEGIEKLEEARQELERALAETGDRDSYRLRLPKKRPGQRDRLYLDIERAKGRAEIEFYDLNDMKGRRINHKDVRRWGRTICVAWAWDDGPVEFIAEWTHGRTEMLRVLRDLLDHADDFSAHNGVNFDFKKIITELRDARLAPPSPVRHIDTLLEARRFGDESKTLDALCRRLGVVGKTDHFDARAADRAIAGDRAAQRRIKEYNLGDIHALRALAEELEPWVPSRPKSLVCGCGSRDFRFGEPLVLRVHSFERLVCVACSAEFKGQKISGDTDVLPAGFRRLT